MEKRRNYKIYRLDIEQPRVPQIAQPPQTDTGYNGPRQEPSGLQPVCKTTDTNLTL